MAANDIDLATCSRELLVSKIINQRTEIKNLLSNIQRGVEAFGDVQRESTYTPNDAEAREFIDHGYRRVSRKYGVIVRIDREDWFEFMIEKHPNMTECDNAVAMCADFYRTMYSKDVLTIGRQRARNIPSSGWDPTGFIPKG